MFINILLKRLKKPCINLYERGHYVHLKIYSLIPKKKTKNELTQHLILQKFSKMSNIRDLEFLILKLGFPGNKSKYFFILFWNKKGMEFQCCFKRLKLKFIIIKVYLRSLFANRIVKHWWIVYSPISSSPFKLKYIFRSILKFLKFKDSRFQGLLLLPPGNAAPDNCTR